MYNAIIKRDIRFFLRDTIMQCGHPVHVRSIVSVILLFLYTSCKYNAIVALPHSILNKLKINLCANVVQSSILGHCCLKMHNITRK